MSAHLEGSEEVSNQCDWKKNKHLHACKKQKRTCDSECITTKHNASEIPSYKNTCRMYRRGTLIHYHCKSIHQYCDLVAFSKSFYLPYCLCQYQLLDAHLSTKSKSFFFNVLSNVEIQGCLRFIEVESMLSHLKKLLLKK